MAPVARGAGLIACAVAVVVLLFQTGRAQDTIWTRRFDSGLLDWSVGGAVDPFGDVVTVGEGEGEFESLSIWIVKYSSAGDTLWVRTYKSDTCSEEPSECAIDPLGNIIIVGNYYWEDSLGGHGGGQILKYDRDGNLLWVRDITTPTGYLFTELWGVVLDDSGYIIAAGDCGIVKATFEFDVLLTKYSPEGESIWARTYDFGGEVSDRLGSLVIDAEGCIVGTGTIETEPSQFDFLAVKFSPEGDTIWSRTYNLYRSDWATDITSDEKGNIYITGWSYKNFPYNSYPVLIKLSPKGETLWTRVYESQYACAYGIGLDSAGNVLLTGEIPAPVGANSCCLLMKYTPAGQLEWIRTYQLDTTTYGVSLSLSGPDIVYLMGTTIDAMSQNPDMFVIKLSYSSGVQSPTFFPTTETPPSFIIFKGEPLRLSLPYSGDYRITLYDITGRCVTRIYQGRLEPGKQEFNLDSNIPSGVYLVWIESPNFSTTSKLIKVE